MKLYPYQQAMLNEIVSHPNEPTNVREAAYAIRHYMRSGRRSLNELNPFGYRRAFEIAFKFGLCRLLEGN